MLGKREAPENFTIPNWPELAVHKVWEHATQLPGISERLPEEWTGGRRTDKKFFWWTVLAQHPEWVQDLVNNCTRQRKLRALAAQQPPRPIQIRHDIALMLVKHEYAIKGKFSRALG